MTSEISTLPKVWTNDKPNEGCLRCSELARRAPQYDLSKDERERPLCEAGNRLVESLDIPVGASKHHTALECSHDVKSSRFRVGSAADPPSQITNAPTEKGLYFLHDLARQNARLGAEHAAEAHPPIALESLSESRTVGGDRFLSRFIRPRCNRGEKSVSITSNDSSGKCRLGRKMVMHACALDTELSRKVAKAEASISGMADMGLSQVH